MGRTGRGLGRRPTTRREGSRPRKPKMQLDGGGCVCVPLSVNTWRLGAVSLRRVPRLLLSCLREEEVLLRDSTPRPSLIATQDF